MSRITKRNDAYLARVQASMDFERKVRQERYDRRNHFENTKMERRHEMKEAHAAQKEAQKELKFEAREEARARNLYSLDAFLHQLCDATNSLDTSNCHKRVSPQSQKTLVP